MAKEPFSLKDVSTLKEGILAEEAGTRPLSRFGVDFSLRPSTVFGALPGIGDLAFLGQAIGKTQLESSATNLLNSTSPNQLDTGLGATMKRAGTGKSATSAVINEIKEFKQSDPYSITENITRDDIQRYMMSKRPDLDLASIQTPRYTRDQLNEGIGLKQQYTTQPFRTGTFERVGEDYRDTLQTLTNRNPSEKDKEFQSAMGSYAIRDMQQRFDDNLKTTSDFAEDNVYQSNVIGSVDPKTGRKAYDKDFARAVTLENQGDAPSESTFICTVLYDMNDMPISIYKYDQRYGQQVNKKIYRGYATWGKPLAERMRNKGLLYKIMKPIALRWAEQMAFDMSEGKVGKKRYAIKVMKFLGEAICYGIGLFIKPEGDKNGTRNRNRQHGEERRVVRRENGVLKKRGRPRTNRRATS